MRLDLSPRHPENEGAAFALLLAAVIGFAMLLLHIWRVSPAG